MLFCELSIIRLTSSFDINQVAVRMSFYMEVLFLSDYCHSLYVLFSAVKFGRMSKKQREKVEEEANYFKGSRPNGYDNSSYDPTLLSTNNNQYPPG